MKLGLENKTAFVSGSTAGIGFAIAEALAREGAHVILNGRTEARLMEAIKKLRAAGITSPLRGICCDMATKEGAEKVIQELPEVDILVNNFGIYQVKAFEDITDEEWLHFFETNVLSGVRLSRHYLAKMKKKNWGRIVFISSESGVQTPKEMIHYGLTKTAQLALSRGLAETTAGTAVTVNSVLPGPTFSEGVETFVQEVGKTKGQSKEEVQANFFKDMRPSSLIQRFATAEEVADLVVFVCSEKSSAINGTALRADGGVVRSIL